LGFFVNTLPIRLQTRSDMSVRSYVYHVASAVASSMDRQRIPFDALVQNLGRSGKQGGGPLFQTMFAMSNIAPELSLGGLDAVSLEIPHIYADHDISIDISLGNDPQTPKLSGSINYAASAFSHRFASSVLECFLHVAQILDGHADQPVADTEIIGLEQRQRLLSYNPDALPMPSGAVLDRFDSCVAEQPEAIAVRGPSGQLTYAQLSAATYELAHAILAAGAEKSDRIALRLGRDVGAVVAMMACLRVGCVFVPVDPDYPQSRVAMIMDDAAPLLTICDQGAGLDERSVEIDGLGRPMAAAQNASKPMPFVSGDDIAYSIYTSGTTGRPKGVLVRQNNLSALIGGMLRRSDLTCDDVVLVFSSFCFDAALENIFCPLSVGAQMVIRPDAVRTPDRSFCELIENAGITYVDLPTGFWHCWIQEISEGRCIPSGRLRCAAIGGEKADPYALQTWFQTPALQACPILNVYGPTETAISATSYLITQDNFDPAGPLPIGRPLDGYRCYIANERGHLCPDGAVGELWIAGNGVSAGYANRPIETAAAFVPNPFDDDGGQAYRTGDLAYWLSPGVLGYAGRKDNQVKFRGYRVELAEIEAFLCAQAGVQAACVLIQSDLGRDARLVAYVLLSDALSVAELRTLAMKGLPDFMVPTHFDQLQHWPLTANGKLDKDALRAWPLPQSTLRQTKVLMTDAQRTVAAIWEEIIGPGLYGPEDNFFHVGGHSLMAIQFISRLETRTGLSITLADMLHNPTIAGIAELSSGEQPAGLITRLTAGSDARPIFGVHAIDGDVAYLNDLAPHLEPGRPVYAIRAQGLKPGEVPHRNLGDFVDHYVGAIKSVQPEGPYTVLGWSSGGTLAWHIADRFLSLEDQVDFLGMIDTCAAYDLTRTSIDALNAKHPGLATLLELVQEQGSRDRLLAHAEDLPDDNAQTLLQLCHEAFSLSADFNLPRLMRMTAVRAGIDQAIQQGDPANAGTLGSVAHVFLASDVERKDPMAGWPDLSSDIELHHVGGSHYSIVSPAYVSRLGAAIRAALPRSVRARIEENAHGS
jgi:amino acid adenylation domain-containing protein